VTDDVPAAECPGPDDPPEGEKLTERDELLWRQVPPIWLEGVPTRLAFRPTPKDKKRLSTARSSMIDARAAYEEHTGTSAGTWAISVGEADDAGAPAYWDGEICGLPEHHASLYFGGQSLRKIDDISKALRSFVNGRGCQYRPEPS
jgi:hypothetical protein